MAGWAATLAANVAWAQAVLPTAYTGPWQGADPPAGWTFSGLGTPDYGPDYDGINDGAAKLDDTGDFISIAFDSAAGSVSYWIKGLSVLSGGVFRVEQSANGTDWTALQTYAYPPETPTLQIHFPAIDARHIRFHYEERITGNVGIDGISIARYVLPAVASIDVAGEVATVAVPESVVGRTYRLEYADVLTGVPVVWTPAGAETGSAAPLVFHGPAPTNAVKRYYRVRDDTP